MPRVLLLLPTTTYRTKAFMDAALKLGVNIVAATEQPSTLAAQNPEGLLTLDFFDPEQVCAQSSQSTPRNTKLMPSSLLTKTLPWSLHQSHRRSV